MDELKSKVAEHYLSLAHAKAEGTSNAIIIWTISLVYIWFFGIERIHTDYRDLNNLVNEKVVINQKISEKRDSLRARYGILKGLDEALIEQKVYYDNAYNEVSNDLGNALVTKKNEIEAAKKEINFKIPPDIDVPVDPQYAPLAWSLLLLGFLVYVGASRARILNLCAKTLRIYRHDLSYKPEHFSDFISMPFWIAPLPTKDSKVFADDLCHALGWQRQKMKTTVYVLIGIFVFFVLQLRVMYINFEVADQFTNDVRHVFLVLNLSILGWLIYYFIHWFRQLVVPDHYANEPSPNSLRRRDILRMSAFSLSFGLLYPVVKVSEIVFKPRVPRFRKHIPSFTSRLAPGYYFNNLSSTIHYVNSDQKIRSIVCINQDNLQPESVASISALTSFKTVSNKRVHLATSSQVLETTALELVSSGKPLDAIILLRASVFHDLFLKSRNSQDKPVAFQHKVTQKPGYRIYDLLAGLSVRFEPDRRNLKVLLRILRDSRNVAQFETRYSKWNNEKSIWFQKWKDKNKKIKWSSTLV
ncbi:hypothetical protein KK083_28615 [Fulvivirgaceae bacterium PWU4]|uniref:Uncharacterized protein n=1 Tax=Chryseosolibacter histidini TaxID=2782349 RepID=A0AAP2DUI6_9BACT|nr:hypothetical protein [Chryseosolibacter histidini]MBT1700889.1 hypothetical protein [Chryseosolibacter histidini]